MAKKKLGDVAVDSGLLFLGDPCYQASESDFNDWDGFCQQIGGSVLHAHRFKAGHLGKGLTFGGFGGDGTYPVYAEIWKNRCIKRTTIDFEGEGT